MSDSKQTILWTKVDEAPALATYSLLPIVKAFLTPDVAVETRDISLSARILANFNHCLTEEQQTHDALADLGRVALTPQANIIKLPNISASVPQLKAAVAELQSKGYAVPDFPENAQSAEDKKNLSHFKKCQGSAVNPVLREGNSDRRAPPAVKAYAKANPHRMGKWSSDSKTRVASMSGGDFYQNEQSIVASAATDVRMEFINAESKETKVYLASLPLLNGEVLDSAFMSKAALLEYYDTHIAQAKKDGVLLSLHLKATMMKVSDPILFGHCVKTYFKALFAEHGETLESIGANVRNGFGDVLSKLNQLSDEKRAAVEATIKSCYDNGPDLAMVNSDKGITNLHVPSDVIIDASVPAMVRDSGKMWNAEGKLQDTLALIPDRSYAGMYQAIVKDCQINGAFDVTTMGTSPNVGLMAKKAEEYGSHNKTFEMPAAGIMRVVDNKSGDVLMEHKVQVGDIWRSCQTKDAPILDWVQLAIRRAKASNTPVVFWLDPKRAHDRSLIAKVNMYLADIDLSGVSQQILDPVRAIEFTLERIRNGQDTISATGNVLRDYLTDLFPILEVGTSAKMLSIVPLMNGGGLFETGAGGSAPKHVQQFTKENYLRWDSLGEFMALAVCLEHIATKSGNTRASVLGKTLDAATTKLLLNNKGPARKLGKIDNRGSHYYLALYWSQFLAEQKDDADLASIFAPHAASLAANEQKINQELIAVQGSACNIGGYYLCDDSLVSAAMRPSSTLTSLIDAIGAARNS